MLFIFSYLYICSASAIFFTTGKWPGPNRGYLTLHGQPLLKGSSMWPRPEKGHVGAVCTRGHIPLEMAPRQKGQWWVTTAGVTTLCTGPGYGKGSTGKIAVGLDAYLLLKGSKSAGCTIESVHINVHSNGPIT